MARRTLVPVDGSEQAEAALEYALDEVEGELLVLHVVDLATFDWHYQRDVVGFGDDWYENAYAAGEEIVQEAADLAAERGSDVETHVEFGHAHEVIVEFAREHDVDHVVVGSHGRSGVSRVLLGSVAETVVRRSPVPVTVVR